MSYFEFFGIPLAFNIDQEALRKAFLSNSREYHPDFAKAKGLDVEEAMEKSSLNNKAYKTLNSPAFNRAYILQIKGLLGADKEQLPMDFLVEMMDLNERVADLQMEHDNKQLQSVLEEYRDWNKTINARLARAEMDFDKSADEAVLQVVKEFHLKHKYILRIKESIDTFAAL
jgi:molecular chaperone HscB